MKMEIKTIWGRKLDNKDKKRRIKIYLLESLIFSVFMALLDIMAIFASKNKAVFYFLDNYTVNFIITVFITTILLFIISFGFNYLICEKSIKKSK